MRNRQYSTIGTPVLRFASAPHLAAACVVLFLICSSEGAPLPYAVVDTGQVECYDNRSKIRSPKPGKSFCGQDAQYCGNPPAYRDNGDGNGQND